MSSILKALEKAEESHSTRRNGGDSGLIRTRTHRPSWVMPAAVLCGAVVAALVTFAAMGGFSRQAPVAQVPAVVAKTGPVVVAPINPVIELPAALSEQTPASPSAGALVLPSPKVAPLPALTGKAARHAMVPMPHPASVQPSPAQTAPEPEAAAAEKAAPALRVTGIAWQNNGESSFAVVNGKAVLQGGVVDGFKVMEIHHDMVRFSGSSGTIDVPLGGEENN